MIYGIGDYAGLGTTLGLLIDADLQWLMVCLLSMGS
jgi:hypothetical protein